MARSFNGSSDIITTTNLNITLPFSFYCWFKPSSLGLFSSHFGSAALGGGNNLGLQVRLENSDKFSIITNNVAIILTSSNTASNGVWNTGFGSYDGSNAVVRLNGTKTTSSPLKTISGNNPYLIGAAGDINGNPQQFWPGSLADMAVWNIILTDSEAVALEAGIRPINIRPQSLLAWWPIDGLASPEPDLSGNKVNGTLTGTTLDSGPPIAPFTPRWPIFSASPTTSDISNISTQSAFIKRLPYAIGY